MQLVIELTPMAAPNEYHVQVGKDPGLDWMVVHQTLAMLVHKIAHEHLQAKPVPLITVVPGSTVTGVH